MKKRRRRQGGNKHCASARGPFLVRHPLSEGSLEDRRAVVALIGQHEQQKFSELLPAVHGLCARINALHAISELVHSDPVRAEQAIVGMGDFLRRSLGSSQRAVLPLSEELASLGTYVDLEKIRLRERLEVEIEVPDEALGLDVPNTILQPLVENSIHHGLRGRERGRIWIRAWRENGTGSFTTSETAVNYFTPLDLYLMGLLPAEDVGAIHYLATDDLTKSALRDKSPVSGFSTAAIRKTATVGQIVERDDRPVVGQRCMESCLRQQQREGGQGGPRRPAFLGHGGLSRARARQPGQALPG